MTSLLTFEILSFVLLKLGFRVFVSMCPISPTTEKYAGLPKFRSLSSKIISFGVMGRHKNVSEVSSATIDRV